MANRRLPVRKTEEILRFKICLWSEQAGDSPKLQCCPEHGSRLPDEGHGRRAEMA